MNDNRYELNHTPARRHKGISRRDVLATGAMAGVAGGFVSALGLPLFTGRADAMGNHKQNDIKILNNALYYEHQAIWAYSFAAGKLTNTDVGKAVLSIALANQADHKQHHLITALQDQDKDVRRRAAEALGNLGTVDCTRSPNGGWCVVIAI